MFAEIQLQGLLSFGPESPTIPLGALNVLIGANSSGKSNLVEVFGLLAALPRRNGLQEGLADGGAREWLWKGGKDGDQRVGTVRVVVRAEAFKGKAAMDVEHSLSIRANSWGAAEIQQERIGEAVAREGEDEPRRYFDFGEDGHGRLYFPGPRHFSTEASSSRSKASNIPEYDGTRSVLASRPGPKDQALIQPLAMQYEEIVIYRDWRFGRGAPARQVCPTHLPHQQLLPDASNLPLVLNALLTSDVYPKLMTAVQDISDQFEDVKIRVQGSSAQLVIRERGGWWTPASRLSDGTLRMLSMLSVLLHHSPPPLVIIEEPELGLHPDMMPMLADLLKDCATRTQVLVTTHSNLLVDAINDASAILVCDKEGSGSSTIRRLDAEALKPWLEEFSLGHLWRSGEIGGNRW